ncbi:bifunctional folylpolyglutamate synthase/dihydrofolate synthase [Pseudodesulfovibrio sp. JC047]|nr:bifunctional folylpolyglutamate synthase/dihydrofolate synthase [Pseudodesulfovibrio sp. JC047]
MDRLGLFHMDLSLDRMKAFMTNHGPIDFPVVHVVGTNGKGSTSAFFSSMARAHGLTVGGFSSPHFVTPRERVHINGTMVSRETWVELANAVLSSPGGDALTYFEFQTCLAVLAFEREGVDVAVMEAGLGGRFDATNVLNPGLTLFTPIGMDHEKILGPTLTDIATDKAGAIQSASVAVTGAQEPDAMIQLQDRAQTVGARLMYAVDLADPVRDVPLGLQGIHQTMNARLALAGWRWFATEHSVSSDSACETAGLKSAFIPGRLQTVFVHGRKIVLDGAHNSHALIALSAALKAQDLRPGCVIFTCLKDKTLAPMIPLVQSLTDGPILVPSMEGQRAQSAESLANSLGEKAQPVPSMQAALEMGADFEGTTLVCGSLYLLAEFYKLYPDFLTV